MFILCHSSQDVETTWMSIDRWMNKEDMCVCINDAYAQWNITQLWKKNEIMPFAAVWMDLEIIILSEVSQKGKDKYHMVSLLCGI